MVLDKIESLPFRSMKNITGILIGNELIMQATLGSVSILMIVILPIHVQ